MNIGSTITGVLKGGVISIVTALIAAEYPAAAKELSDGQAALADGKLSLAEATQIAADSCDTAAELAPKYAAACTALKTFIEKDIPVIETEIVPDAEAVVAAFEAA